MMMLIMYHAAMSMICGGNDGNVGNVGNLLIMEKFVFSQNFSNTDQVTCVILDTIKLILTPHWNELKFQIRSRASISFSSIHLHICR